MTRLLAWLAWWIVLFWLWMLLVGEWNRIEWIAGACAATVGATIAEALRAASGIRTRLRLASLRELGTSLGMVPVDFALVVAALVRSALRRRIVRGSFHSREHDPGGDDPLSVGTRAWKVFLACISSNAYVVSLDREQKLVLVHRLVPFRKSEDPV